MAFEVADDSYKFDGFPIPQGTFLLDVFKDPPLFEGDVKDSWRNVEDDDYDRFTEFIDPLEMCCYIYNEWDEYRDNFRDGRYQEDSLTVTDYILANSPLMGFESEEVDAHFYHNDPAKNHEVAERLESAREKLTMDIRKRSSPSAVNAPRVPSHLNPAFDMRAIPLSSLKALLKGESTKDSDDEGNLFFNYIGKKRYYGHVDEATIPEDIWKGDQAHKRYSISSRGLSMFIIETISRGGKYLAEIKEDLIEVGKRSGGYDYGPRLFETDFPKDPFNLTNLRELNEKVERGLKGKKK